MNAYIHQRLVAHVSPNVRHFYTHMHNLHMVHMRNISCVFVGLPATAATDTSPEGLASLGIYTCVFMFVGAPTDKSLLKTAVLAYM